MDIILAYIKSYFILTLLLLVLSYLAPEDRYKRYFQYFIGVWMCVLLLRPVMTWFGSGEDVAYVSMQELEERLSEIDKWQGDGVDIFEIFSIDGEME